MVADPDYGKSASMLAQVGYCHSTTALRRSGSRRPGVHATARHRCRRRRRSKTLLKLDDQNVLTGANATEAKLKQLHGPRILHMATHGFFLNDKEIGAAALEAGGLHARPTPRAARRESAAALGTRAGRCQRAPLGSEMTTAS